MKLLIVAVGVIILLVGLAFVLFPYRVKPFFNRLIDDGRTDVAVFIRAAFGALLLAAAPETREPSIAVALGVLFWISAAAIPLFGPSRVRRFAEWWLRRPGLVLRASGMLTAAFGVFVTWLGL